MMETAPHHIIIMGVAGSGKTTIGKRLASTLSLRFLEGDDLHPTANRVKMIAGERLSDDDRWPWLGRVNREMRDSTCSLVVSCSALHSAYRQFLLEGVTASFVCLQLTEEVTLQRVKQREHFFPDSLVHDQFKTLQVPDESESILIDADQTPEHITSMIIRSLPAVRFAQQKT